MAELSAGPELPALAADELLPEPLLLSDELAPPELDAEPTLSAPPPLEESSWDCSKLLLELLLLVASDWELADCLFNEFWGGLWPAWTPSGLGCLTGQ
ncbi:MAG: hypothetical protein JF887_08100 [Candidatus Dormibacteraeota bacterium]|uniref:Uncharacterized protein n=1 Tax=Candidatus Amunia macphersoniae TaxID=3127014 RepID=A0A934KMZ8_9BACT|nr:hypothetical protein [Candidatus Dormibacteraeota bacterium]